MSDAQAPAAPTGEEGAAAAPAVPTQEAWDALAKQGLLPAMAGLPFAAAQPFMFPGYMLPGFGIPGFGLPAEGEGHAEGEGSGEDDDDDTEAEGGDDDDDSEKEGGRAKRKRGARGKKKGDGVVKSNSNAALAMLAGAAATKPGMPGANPAVAAMQQSLEGMWGTLQGGAAAGLPATASQIDISKLTAAEQQQLLAAGEYGGITDERELKRLRRKQSNRESARRSRLRKQAECEQLGRQVKDLLQENARLKEEKMHLLSQIEVLNAKLSMSAFGAMHTLGGGAADKQAQDMQSMAVAMAQAMQNGGAMMPAGLGIPTIDPAALEGKTPEEAAAVAAAAVAAAGEQLQVAAAMGAEQPDGTVQ